jgi:formylglycine-generating enzyme required for sulfatase activity/tRNA A-37 threonylcarbamoyl transferase component Bud32
MRLSRGTAIADDRSTLPPLQDADEPTSETCTMGFEATTGPAPRVLPTILRGDRYVDLGRIGTGGMGEVRRVLDRELHRVMAMKIIRKDLADLPMVVGRFVEEAQATAQLEHPGIVPVHDLGRLPDGRVYFTMKEVKGTTFGALIRDVHKVSRGGEWATTDGGWGFVRLIDAFRKVCEAVAYAHARGVVHRDLKPDNVMVGEYGEVLVVDWGLAKILGDSRPDAEGITSDRSDDESMWTQLGTVAGTPAYMPPEQAAGALSQLGPPSDVYALGVILDEILHGRADDVVAPDLAIPQPLCAIVTIAKATVPADRYPDAAALAAEVTAWLEGARKREQALALVAEARSALPRVEALFARARDLRDAANHGLEAVPAYAPVDAKRPHWAALDEAAACERDAILRQVEVNQQLRAALSLIPDLAEANDALAEYCRNRHADAELHRDAATAAQYEALLRAHDTGRHTEYLRGDGRLTLLTEPAGADVMLHRYEERDRRLIPVPVRSLGQTPLHGVVLPMGSYLLTLTRPGHAKLAYPVQIERQGHADGLGPDGAPHPIVLPRDNELGAHEIYVPAGWTWVGGDKAAIGALPRRRLWVDACVVGEFPVTRGEYLAFLEDLVATGRKDDALAFAPGELTPTGGATGRVAWPDTDPDHPVTGIDWFGARAYAAWFAARTGRPWRLPGDVEWEKAARGVDGRLFPWGDHLDATFTCFMASHAGHPEAKPVGSYPIDASPYGIRGLGGNVRDWCADVYHRHGAPVVDGRVPVGADDARPEPPRVIRGGCWSHHDGLVRAATRWWESSTARAAWYGFRVARSYPG